MLKSDIKKEIEKYQELVIDAQNRKSYRVNLLQVYLGKLKKSEKTLDKAN